MIQPTKYDEWVEYETKYGDTFDGLSMDMYDTELYASEIIKENPHYADVLIFSAGIILYLPVIENTQDKTNLPPWEQGVDGD